jgi:hypothetical protein
MTHGSTELWTLDLGFSKLTISFEFEKNYIIGLCGCHILRISHCGIKINSYVVVGHV